MDEIMQIFLYRSSGGHLPLEPINVNEWDPFAELGPWNVGGATHQFLQPVDLLTGEDDRVTGGASSSQGPPGRLPFHGPNSPESQETFPDEEDPDFMTTDEEYEEEVGKNIHGVGSSARMKESQGGKRLPTSGWSSSPSSRVTDLEKLMQKPWGDEEPEGQATRSSANDKPDDKDEKNEATHRGESKWLMQNRLREGRRTAWSR